MKEIVIISGKGGTGKTSLTGAFAALSPNSVLADCDVDAADLHLLLTPKVITKHNFISGKEAIINTAKCIGCGSCTDLCHFDAITGGSGSPTLVDPSSCEGCGVCVRFCPSQAIDFPARTCGEWYSSETRFGPMIHARLGITAENSGKLVSLVRSEARQKATDTEAELILTDGPPGIGCPVIASITDADAVVIVTEPSLSGQHDLERVKQLADHFNIPVFVCINKWDINPELSKEIELFINDSQATFLGKISYTTDFTKAQLAQKSIVEYNDSRASQEVKAIWQAFSCSIKEKDKENISEKKH